MFFEDRTDAGQKLAQSLLESGRDFTGVVVVGIARGGIVIAQQIAKALKLPMNAIFQRDVYQEGRIVVATGFNMGLSIPAIEGAVPPAMFVDDLKSLGGDVEKKVAEIHLKQVLWELPAAIHARQRVILCDDGIVSGKSVTNAYRVLRHLGAFEVVAAFPVTHESLGPDVLGCDVIGWRESFADTPQPTGMYFFDFEDVTPEEIEAGLQFSRHSSS